MKGIALNPQEIHALIRGGIVKSLLTVMVVMQLVACGGGGGGGGGGGSGASGSGSGTVSSSGTSTAASNSTSKSTTSGQSSAKATGSLSLSWVAPVARADGTPLSSSGTDSPWLLRMTDRW